jgi:UDP-N-acetylmuramoyl-tripeptide--D-alanyl-D-alanine ligase
MNIIKLKNGNILLDDTYNANPLSVSQSLKTLSQVSSAQCLVPIFVFGQMNELGVYEKSTHEQIGKLVKKLNIKEFYCLGPATKYSIESAGFGKYFESLDNLTKAVSQISNHKSQIILVKGSRFWHLENLIPLFSVK